MNFHHAVPLRFRSGRLRTLLVTVVVMVSIGAAVNPAQAAAQRATAIDYPQITQDEANWISGAQIPNGCGAASGALAWYPYGNSGVAQIRPYVANIGAIGMLAAGSHYFPMVKAWISWYFAHINRPDRNGISGTVYDYDDNVAACTETYATNASGQRPSYDSSDAYAGTFLSLLQTYAQDNPKDDAFLRSESSNIALVANVILHTTAANGLTIATPQYPAQYLMDNVEAYQGLVAYSWLLENALNQRVSATSYIADAAAMEKAIDNNLRLTSTVPGMYAWAADQRSPSWNTWYPDSVAQAWPLKAEIGTASQRSSIWSTFEAKWPEWTTTANNPDGSPWCALGYTAALLGDKAAADAFLQNSQAVWVNAGRPWPYTIMDSAYRALTANVAATL